MTDYFQDLESSVAFALAEDIGSGDITVELIPENETATAEVITRDNCVVCGQAWVTEVFKQAAPDTQLEWLVEEASSASANTTLFRVTGNARQILTAERPALNFLQTLSGTATTTQRYAGLIAHTSTRLLDTRKTIPGLRLAQKYAVHCGGGMNHRIGLYDAFLIKENHILACGSITDAITKARTLYPERRLEIEVENLEEYAEALAAKPDWIMLDNFDLEDMRTAVKENTSDAIKLEASGGIENDDDFVRIAETGVDFISVGALTKHLRAVDLSLRILD